VDARPSVIIVGAGISGLTCALALQQRGLRPKVFEQAPLLRELGAGLQLSPNAMSVMTELGLQQALLEKGSLPKGIRSINWRSGNETTRVPFAELDFHSPYVHIHRADLQQVLLDAVRANDPDSVLTGQHVEAVVTEQSGMSLLIRHGDSVSADWVIGADGIRSRCRDYVVCDNAAPRFTGNVAWRGLLRTDSLPEGLRPPRWANIWMGPGGHVVMYYLRGGELINFVAVREQSDWLEESWNAPASLRDLLHDFADWDPTLFQLLSHADPKSCFRWALFDRDPIDQWYRDRLILIGDAAHPMLPFLAQGAAMGIEDSWVLSELIATGNGDIGAQFQALREQRCSRVQQLARDNMRLFHHHNAVLRTGRDLVARGLSAINPSLAAKRVAWIYDWRATTASAAAPASHS
jgi:salicylate hydroxylase